MKIDIHSHVFPKDACGSAGKYGPEIITDKDGVTVLRSGSTKWRTPEFMSPESLWDPTIRAAEMDRRGVDMVGVTASPQFYLYWIEHDLAISLATAVNESLAAYCQAVPGRFFFMANLPLQDIDASLKELDKASSELGAKGINIATDAVGHSLEEEYFWPIYEKAEELELPFFVHPLAANAVGDPGDQPDNPRYDFNSRHVLQARIGYLYQEASTVINLMMGGVFDRFPNLKFCIPHGGGFVPYQFQRFAMTAEREPDANSAEKPLGEYLKNFYFDTIVHDIRARRLLVDFMGADNVVVGSNFPGWDEGNGFDFVEELGLDDEANAKIMGGNAQRIFKL